MTDQDIYGREEVWAYPKDAGDCEDYAIAKLVALRAAGIAADDLRLVIIRETTTGG